MISEQNQELASDYALGMMSAADEREFELQMLVDEELRVFVRELREAAAAVSHVAPQLQPPPGLKERLVSSLRAEAAAGPSATASEKPRARESSAGGLLPWAIAAGLAIMAAAFWTESNTSKKDAAFWKSEALRARNEDVLKDLKIATLTAQNGAFAKAGATVVWDPAKKKGILKLSNVPAAASGKDYQLWVIDPKYPKPVNGGIVTVGENGLARQEFTPDQPIGKPDKFAISIEKEGGVPVGAGPIVLIGD